MVALTIGMATYDDFDGVYFTIQALRLYQDLTNSEILVVDNYGCDDTRKFVESVPDARYIRADGEVISHGWALNEASLEKGPRLGVLGVVLEIDGRPVSAFGCDGVLVSSPTGSTAYAFSAGGPVVWPDLEAILVVPNNAHALFARPMVTSPNAMIAIEIDADSHDALVFCDGRREMTVPAGGRLEVTKCGTPLKWVRLDSAPFTDRLVRKFRLPVTGWRGQ